MTPITPRSIKINNCNWKPAKRLFRMGLMVQKYCSVPDTREKELVISSIAETKKKQQKKNEFLD